MKIILNKDVYNLGEEGDICDVARGYARNYLLPQKLAVLCTNENKAIFESRKGAIEKRKEEKRKLARSLKERIEETSLTIRMSAGDSGKLFGAVTTATIAEALAKEGIEMERKNIEIPSSSIKMVGDYTAKVKLYESELADLQVKVVSEKEAEREAAEAEEKAAEASAAAAAEKKAAAEAVQENQAEDDAEPEHISAEVSENEPAEEEPAEDAGADEAAEQADASEDEAAEEEKKE